MDKKFKVNEKRLVPGLAFLALGLIFTFGTIPFLDFQNLGYFPGACAVLLTIVGIIETIRGLTAKEAVKVKLDGWKEYFIILVSILAFGILARPLGVVFSIAICVILSCVQTLRTRWKEILIIAVICAAFVYVVFIRIFQVNVPVWPWS